MVQDRSAHAPVPIWNRQRFAGRGQSHPDFAQHRLVQHFSHVSPFRQEQHPGGIPVAAEDWITHWQQSLLRIGYHVQLHPRVTARLGYGWIETFAYGEIPLNSFGKQFTEHRLFQAIVLQDEVRRLSISQRWMLEERWLGRYANAAATKEEGFDLLGRFRYLLRLQHPISKPSDNKRFSTSPLTTSSSSALAGT